MTAAPDAAARDRIRRSAAHRCIALVGNPNSGKTTLFNRLCGLRARTANFPGTTVEARLGTTGDGVARYNVIDLPGHYGLNLDRPESRVCREYLGGSVPRLPRPDAVLIVLDATNLARNLVFASQALQQGIPAVVALNMIDSARARGVRIDVAALEARLGCPVVAVSARSGEGLAALLEALRAPRLSAVPLPDPEVAQGAAEWAQRVARACAGGAEAHGADSLTDRLDSILTHPVLGLLVFAAVMTGLFWVIFSLASLPMDLIELLFAHLGRWVGACVPEGPIRELLADGIVAGVAGTVVFLPQICLLFFLIGLLEDTGYLARAVFVTDRYMRRFGLPGAAFVPLLSAHACAIPAIMSARLVADRRERLATILVAPFLSCSARLPVYVLLVGLLYHDRPAAAGLAFCGCYALGAAAALISAWLARRTILRGPSDPMVLELPAYKLPSLRTALMTTLDRAVVFLRKAGTLIVVICIVLWWLGEYPHVAAPPQSALLREAAAAAAPVDPLEARELLRRAAELDARHAKSRSFIGHIGRGLEPLFAPLGADWQITVGILSSFLAREVFVSTMAVVVAGTEDYDEGTVRARIAAATRSDGSPMLDRSTAASLLVFYVLAMQCLPTLAVTAREAGGWRWAAAQLLWMSGLAYAAALLVRGALSWAGSA
jgi:ferrous iron transport protein B